MVEWVMLSDDAMKLLGIHQAGEPMTEVEEVVVQEGVVAAGQQEEAEEQNVTSYMRQFTQQ